MEEICATLSSLLSKEGTGGYKIYYEEDLIDALPDNVRNRETLEAALKNLHGGGYIDVKYARGSAFCIAFLKLYHAAEKPQPSPIEPTEVEIKEQPAPALSAKKMYLAAGLSAFIGGAISGCIAAVLGAVL